MSVQGTLGALLQGVSQQSPHIRVDGQVGEQVNFHSDVSTGLTSRPGTDFISVLSEATADMKFQDLYFKGDPYIIGYKHHTLHIWDVNGVIQQVSDVEINKAYLGEDMRFAVFGDEIYVVNRGMRTSRPVTTSGHAFRFALITALGGNFTRTYTVKLNFMEIAAPGVVPSVNQDVSVSYTTPHGDVSGDAEKSTSSYIIQQLKNALSSGLPSGTEVLSSAEVLLVKHPTLKITCSVEDQDAGKILRVTTGVVEDATHLPKYAPHGAVTRVVGDAADEDDYFLRFISDTVTTEGDGFGESGVWREWRDVDQPHTISKSTMPHAISHDPTTNIFTFGQAAWEDRRVGNDDSNPMPSFIGLAIRDAGGFEGRLVFVAGPNVIMSRTGKPLDFFRKSATVSVASDPIDMRSTKESSVTLDHIIQFDRDLILLSDPGDSQFLIKGGGLTRDNASIVLTTSFEMFGQARPVTTGRTLIFPFRSGIYSGLKEFFTNDTISTNGADTITEVQDRYIPGDVTCLASSKNFNLILLTTSNTDTDKNVWIFKYLWDGTKRLQSSWSRWEFSHKVMFLFFRNSTLYLVLDRGKDRILVESDMNRPVDSLLGYHVTMDNRETVTVAQGKIPLTYNDALLVQGKGCPFPGIPAIPAVVTGSGTSYEYHFTTPITDGMELISGTRIERYVEPTMPGIRDRNGTRVSAAVCTILKFMVHTENTGYVSARLISPFREDTQFDDFRYPLDDEPTDPNRTLLNSRVIQVPWGERSDYSQLRVLSDDTRPTTITEIEWTAQVTRTRRRV